MFIDLRAMCRVFSSTLQPIPRLAEKSILLSWCSSKLAETMRLSIRWDNIQGPDRNQHNHVRPQPTKDGFWERSQRAYQRVSASLPV